MLLSYLRSSDIIYLLEFERLFTGIPSLLAFEHHCPSHSNVERATHCQLAFKNKSIGSNIVMIVCGAPEVSERPVFNMNAGPNHDKQ